MVRVEIAEAVPRPLSMRSSTIPVGTIRSSARRIVAASACGADGNLVVLAECLFFERAQTGNGDQNSRP